jgi:adenylate cyclase
LGESIRIKGPAGAKALRDDALHDAIEQQHATARILQILSQSAFDPRAVFQTIVDSALHLCRADSATMVLTDEDRARIVANAGYFADEAAYTKAFGDLPLQADRTTITGRVLLERKTVHIPELHDAGQELRRVAGPATGSRAIVAAPLLRDDEVVGVLIVRRRIPGPFSERHIHLLETFAAQAVIAIENTRLFGTISRQAQELSRFMSPQIAALITSDAGERLLDGHRQLITALFCDLRRFTAFSEVAEPEEVLRVLRQYHSAMGELIVEHKGTLEHFAGDGMMVFFNDPVELKDHELTAVKLGLAMRERFADLASDWVRSGYDLGLGIGIATGYATLGRIGFVGRYDYGAVGNVVICASRLSAEAHPGQILVSQRVHAAVEQSVASVHLGELLLKGMTRPTITFEIVSAN